MRVSRFLLLLAAVSLALAPTGCVRRRMTIRTNPAGATAFVDDQEVGVTPVSTPFTYYGTRKVQLFRDGYETLTVKQPMPAPWYQVPPLDFFFENLWPFELRDERVLQFELPAQTNMPNEKVIERGEMLRNGVRAGTLTPLPRPVTTTP
ncbi:MAG: PEGA domain-containing protein [Pirellulaceae bacterium]